VELGTLGESTTANFFRLFPKAANAS